MDFDPAEPPVPFLAEFNLCEAFGWTEQDCREASPAFKEAMQMILEAKNTAAQSAADEARRKADQK